MENDAFGSLANIENELKKQLEEADKGEDTADVSKDEDIVVDNEDTQDAVADDDDTLAASGEEHKDEDRKKNSAWAKMRAEQKELRENLAVEAKEKQELRERLARLEGRTDALAPKAKEDNADNEPDKDLYPEDHLSWRQRQLDKKHEEIDQRLSRFEQESNVEKAQRAVDFIENDFKSANSKEDYDGAVKFLMDKEVAIKKLMNPSLTDAQIQAQTKIEKMQLFANLHSQGKNPADFVYETAKIHGFKPNASKSDNAQGKVDLKRVADNQRRATNLIGGSPASPNNSSKMSAEQILGLSMQEQAKLYAKNPRVFDESLS